MNTNKGFKTVQRVLKYGQIINYGSIIPDVRAQHLNSQTKNQLEQQTNFYK